MTPLKVWKCGYTQVEATTLNQVPQLKLNVQVFWYPYTVTWHDQPQVKPGQFKFYYNLRGVWNSRLPCNMRSTIIFSGVAFVLWIGLFNFFISTKFELGQILQVGSDLVGITGLVRNGQPWVSLSDTSDTTTQPSPEPTHGTHPRNPPTEHTHRTHPRNPPTEPTHGTHVYFTPIQACCCWTIWINMRYIHSIYSGMITCYVS